MARSRRGLGDFGRGLIGAEPAEAVNTPAAQPSPRTVEDARNETYRRAGISAPDAEGYSWVIPTSTQWPNVKGNPPGPRTRLAGYSLYEKRIRMVFRDGATYVYDNVSPQEWERVRRTASTGKFINRVLDRHPYSPERFDYPS